MRICDRCSNKDGKTRVRARGGTLHQTQEGRTDGP